MTSHAHLLAGVAVSIVATVAYNVGFVLEKHALGQVPSVHAKRIGHLVGSVASSPVWLAGFVCVIAGLGLQVVALSLVSISVVQPILVSGIVVLIVLSHVLLKEHLSRREWAAVCVVAISLLAISLSLDSSSDNPGDHGAFHSIAFAAVPTVLLAVWLFLSADRRSDGHLSRRFHLRAPLFGLSTGLIYGVATLSTKAIAAEVQHEGIVPAIPHVLESVYLYALIITCLVGLLLFQTALQRCPASIVVPVSNVVSSAYVLAVGTLIFSEHLPTSSWKLVARVIGFVGVLVSVLLFTGARPLAEPDLPIVEGSVTVPIGGGDVPQPSEGPSAK